MMFPGHPFHYHGHNFQVISRSPSYGEDFYSLKDNVNPLAFDPNNHTAFPEYPMRRDTVVLPPMGNLVIRFVANNPGVWAFHCAYPGTVYETHRSIANSHTRSH